MSARDWFGETPEGWKSSPLGYYFDVVLGKMLNASKNSGNGALAPYLAAGSIQPDHLVLDDSKMMAFSEGELARYALRRNDVVVVEGGAGYGRSHLLREDLPGWGFQNHVARLRMRGGAEAGFVMYCLKACLASGFIEASNHTATLPSLSRDVLRSLRIPLPPVDEQRAIADYLDRETARIDTLIEEQQRLIEMLRERRQAVVDAAFAPLGESRVQLRRYIKFLTSGSRGWGDYYADEGERFLRIGNLPRTNLSIRGEVQFVDLPTNVTEGSRTMLAAGDLLFSITAYLGSVAVVDGDWIGSYVSQHVALCRLDTDRLDPRFAGWFMLSTSGQDQLSEGAAGGTKIQLALDDIRGLRVPTASMDEQRRIASHLDEETARIDTLIAETERFIELSSERRSALITAAVTGQIDVREAA